MAKQLGRYLFLVHGWTGLVGGAVLFLVALSGAVLAFSDELDRLIYPRVWKVEAGDRRVSLDSMLASVRSAYPEARGIGVRRIPERPDLSYEFSFMRKTGPDRYGAWTVANVDPYTGNLLGERIGRESLREHFTGWLLAFHYSLQAKKAGKCVVGILSVLFTISLVTGLWFYRRQVLGLLLFRKPLPFRDLRTAFSSLHRVLGVWGLLFNLLLAVTGFWMMRSVFTPAFYTQETWQPPVDRPSGVSADTVLHRVRTAHPDFIPRYLGLPDAEDSGYSLGGRFRDQSVLYPEWSSTISLDTEGRIREVKRIDRQPLGKRIEQMVYALHFGQFGGWPLKLLYLIGGLTAPILSVTGYFIALRRRRRSAPPRESTGGTSPSRRTVLVSPEVRSLGIAALSLFLCGCLSGSGNSPDNLEKARVDRFYGCWFEVDGPHGAGAACREAGTKTRVRYVRAGKGRTCGAKWRLFEAPQGWKD